MREASVSRLPRAKEAKSIRLGEPERWPIAAAIHLCATSHTSPSPPLPLLKAVCVYDGIMGVRTSYFSFLKTSATKFRLRERILILRRILTFAGFPSR